MRTLSFQPREMVVNKFFVPGTEHSWSQPDDELGWINKPGISVSIEEGNAKMKFLSHSRRAASDAELSTEDRVPVMIVGGSNAQSYGVRDEDTFPYLLNKRFPTLSFENFGTGGYGTVQAFLLGRRVYTKFYQLEAPRMLIFTFADSHMARNVSDQSWIYSITDSIGLFVSPPHYRMEKGELRFQPFRTIGLWPLEDKSALITTLHQIWLQSVEYNTAAQAKTVTRHIFDEVALFAQQKEMLFLVLVLEDRAQVAAALFEKANYPILDCSGFERTAPKKYLLGGGSHPNELLHAHFASCIGAWIGANALVERLVSSQ